MSALFEVRHQGYTSEVKTVTDGSAAHRDLLGMGFTCDRQDYDADDNVIASYFHHKVNTEWTAQVVAIPEAGA
jgi:hypothetical protein